MCFAFTVIAIAVARNRKKKKEEEELRRQEEEAAQEEREFQRQRATRNTTFTRLGENSRNSSSTRLQNDMNSFLEY